MSTDLLDATGTAWQRLQAQWEATQEQWNDATTEYFAHHHWEPLADETAAFQAALADLTELMAEVQYTVNQL